LYHSVPPTVRDPSLRLTQFLKTVIFCTSLWNTTIAPS